MQATNRYAPPHRPPPSLADPRHLLAFFAEVRLDTMVTVVDSGTFLEAYTSSDTMQQRPDLGVSGK